MLQNILNQNIWWQDKGLISHDPHIRRLNESKFKWRPAVLDEFDLNQFAVYSLRGPRQVGKTTAVKILIRELLAAPDISKEQVMYYSCDTIDTHKELVELLETYLSYAQKLNLRDKRSYIFLDEITSVKDWQKGIKHLVDMGALTNAGMILTGSNATDLRRGVERLPGRRGRIKSPDKILLPLKFREYLQLIDPELFRKVSEGISGLSGFFNLGKEEFQALASLQPFFKRLKVIYEQFLLTGGFITAINSFFEDGEISTAVYELYQQWLRGDIAKSGRSERAARQIISELIRISVSAFGWETIVKKIDIATHKTVSEYMEVMEDSFVLKTLYQIELHTGRQKIRKLKKVYFLDSFILWSLWGWVDSWLALNDKVKQQLIEPETKARLAEAVVANELFSRFDKADWLNSNIFFWRNGGEIDFIVSQEKRLFPVEVTYQNNVSFSDFGEMKKQGFRKGIIVSKNTLDIKDGFLIVPIEMFLLT